MKENARNLNNIRKVKLPDSIRNKINDIFLDFNLKIYINIFDEIMKIYKVKCL